MTTDPIAIALGHNRWANRQIIELCVPLSEEAFHRRFEMGPGSLFATTTHMVGCVLRWTDRIRGGPVAPSIETDGVRRTPAQLAELNDRACDVFAQVIAAAGPVESLKTVTLRQTYTFPVATLALHVTNHGMHHRAQCMNMLRHCGVKIEHAYDELDWQLAGEG